LAIHISFVREIIVFSNATALPKMPPSMVGIISLRGEVVPIVDLKHRFSMKSCDAQEGSNQRVVIVEIDGSVVGCLVDSVSEVIRASEQSLDYMDQIQGMHRGVVDSICKLGDRLIAILNPRRLMTNEEIKQLDNAARERTVCSGIYD
jgi:purine-binding chemotaxis protein CheW